MIRLPLLFAFLLCGISLGNCQTPDNAVEIEERSFEELGDAVEQVEEISEAEDSFAAEDVVAANAYVGAVGVADWLGPLAPVALSPFFGVTCMSALALFFPDWVGDNALLSASGPLHSKTLFCLFLALTVLTSLPRLTKVSKPFAQATDRLETYAVIIILLVIKVIASFESGQETTQVAMVELGVVSFTFDTLLAIAMVINVLVINSVKFFCEFMVWLTPIPAVDAMFEFANKTLCAALMTVYAFSPTIATVFNLAILLVAAIVLRWIGRQVRYYRTMVLDPMISRLWTRYGDPKRSEMVMFCKEPMGPFAAKSRLRMTRVADGQGWHLREANWWMPSHQHPIAETCRPQLRRGWVMHTIMITDADGKAYEFAVSRRYDRSLDTLAERIGLLVTSDSDEKQPQATPIAAQF
ncbi:hypothetical protein SH528x_003148 [Novipirellula sp. SH528]|uniref:hypothetical protein n=1 Tax=Novipirellula sp. SH528 TaxID=3454466 RepID=UPI003FA17373